VSQEHFPVNFIRGVYGFIALALFLGLVHAAAMKGFGWALGQYWRDSVGYPGIEDAYHRSERQNYALEAAHNDCKSRSDAVRLTRAQYHAVDMWMDISAGEAALAQAAYYLDCLTGRTPKRFCHKEHRAHLAEVVRDYFKLKRRVREAWALTTRNPMGVSQQLGHVPGRGTDGFPVNMPSSRTDPRIVSGLRDLIVRGYITHSDLGGFWGLPGDLDTALKGVERKRDECA
jgi:hypothetical protein